MEKFEIKSQQTSISAVYENDEVKISVSYTKDAENKIRSFNGSVNTQDNAKYLGSFSGFVEDREVKYTFNQVRLEDVPSVTENVHKVETYILGQKEQTNE